MGRETNNFYIVHATLSAENIVWGLGFALQAMGMNEKGNKWYLKCKLVLGRVGNVGKLV